MSIRTFAAIDVGSYELTIKIFEFSGKDSMREIDRVSKRLDLGSDTYASGKISNEKMDELCRTLNDFSDIMKAYKVDHYKAYGTSAIREMENTIIVQDQIAQRTGIKVEILSNSEQRFMDYKSVASKGESFRKIIEERTAILDIGGGSIQLSLFDNDTLVSTQNVRLGVLRIQDYLNRFSVKSTQMEDVIYEMAMARLDTYEKLYLKDREIQNLIIVDDNLFPRLHLIFLGIEPQVYRQVVVRTQHGHVGYVETVGVDPRHGRNRAERGYSKNIMSFHDATRLKNIHYVEGQFGGAEIVVGPVVGHFRATFGAGIRIIACIDPSNADLGLDIPVGMYRPCIAIGHARAGSPALVAHILQFCEIGAQKFSTVLPVSEIELSAESMQTEEMTGETSAEPVASFGLDEPVLPAAVFDRPCVELATHVERPFRGQSDLKSEVGRQRGVGDKVGLQCEVLGSERGSKSENSQERYP